MLSTRLTTTDNGVLSHDFIPENVRSLIERRTTGNKIFGKLEIIAPRNERADTDTYTDTAAATAAPRNVIACFLLDTSGSMQGPKIQHAIKTIKQLVEVLHSERKGKTIKHQPIHSWICLITFNSTANLIIPFQEITDETLPNINSHLDHIYSNGSTNYERGFQKQTEVLEEIIAKLEADAAAAATSTATATATTSTTQDHQSSEASAVGGRNPQRTPPQHYHVVRFFETDGDITEGSRNSQKLYEMMRNTTTTTTTGTETTTTTSLRLTFENVILGYGRDVELGCLKILASPYAASAAASTAASAANQNYNCSSLIPIINPEDIGWQVGEILFKVIMRFGFKVQVEISTSDDAATVELFEYQTHQWSSSTTLHSMIHGENKSLYIQYTPADTPDDAPTAPPAVAPIHVKIKYENQFTGSTYTYELAHDIIRHQTPVLVPDLPTESVAAAAAASTIQTVTPLILGMIQIEIFKQFREIEAERYEKDTIVREAYKTLRMLNSIDAITRQSFPAIACQTLNLMTDAKVIIGLTTFRNQKEQNIILHARRICSAEQDIFNTGAKISRQYVDFEEDYEEDAIRVIKAYQANPNANANANPNANEDDGDEDGEEVADVLPSRIPTQCCDYMPTPFPGGGGASSTYYRNAASNRMAGSEVRTLCVQIALSKKKKEDITVEKLYERMRSSSYHHRDYYQDQDQDQDQDQYQDRTDEMFSSTPMDDEYTQRRMGMMRQISSSSS
jgi:hypothetical protein